MKSKIKIWLAELELRTVRRDEDPQDTEARIELYAADLEAYDPMRVRQVLTDWPKSHRFFPTMAELVEKLTVPTRPQEHKALPAYETKRDPKVAEGLRQLVADLKSGRGRDPEYGRRKAQWEIEAEREERGEG